MTASRATDPPLVLYGLSDSVYTRIARLALLEKGVAFSLQETDVFEDPAVRAEHLSRHPFGLVPALRHGDFELYETVAIARYVDRAFEGPPLQPTAPRLVARMTQLVALLDAYAYRPMVWQVFVETFKPGGSDEATLASGIARSHECLRALDALRSEPFLVGECLSLADLHAYPMLRFLDLTRAGSRALDDFAGLRRWLDQIADRRSVLATRASYEDRLGR